MCILILTESITFSIEYIGPICICLLYILTGEKLAEAETKNIVSEEEFRMFWVSWQKGEIKVSPEYSNYLYRCGHRCIQ